MAENEDSTDASQKTEEPTARKLEEAHKRGQVVFSREVTSWVMLFTATILVLTAGPGLMTGLRDSLKIFLAHPDRIPTDALGLSGVLRDLFLEVGGVMVLPLLALSVMAALAGFIQTGPLFTVDPIKPDLSKISLIKGFSRLFSMRSIVEFIKGLIKLAVVSLAGVIVLRPYFDSVEHFVGLDLGQGLFDLETLFLKMMIAVLAVLSVLSVMDYLYQRHDFMKKMRMSKQEIKDEFKQTEGDPQVKARLRELRERRARQRMMQAVPEADVVITNPTHFAVALKYDTKDMPAPMMVAKGTDLIAEKIKEIAKEHKVPIVENAPLARALYDSMEIDQVIPPEHYKTVAEVIRYVFRLKGKKI